MKTAKELLQIARSLDLSFSNFERTSDQLMILTFLPLFVSWADLQILEERFGDSLWNYGFYGFDSNHSRFVVAVRPSKFDF